ncbi:unnamed protein product [Phytophthora fragariaefolia]|uniref:Unnamed protein product n=1 Tax=Phytophthora fragariaefolia TaxID=1490495 RepID=A0A9W6YJP3_9STRA|nr:unnamed protein product [Phytophthora fragariaefolia]
MLTHSKLKKITNNKKQAKTTELEEQIDTTKELLNGIEDQEERKAHLSHVYTLLAIRHISEPKTYMAAMKLPEASHWDAAARSEYKSLMDNKTWILTTLPNGRRALLCRWVFVVKCKGDGSIDRYKARLVIKGFLQKYGIDYGEIFSPVIHMEVRRPLLTIATLLDLEIHRMDV